MPNSLFKVDYGRGFHLTFANGFTASVQWGKDNYCENREPYNIDKFIQEIMHGGASCIDAEVACVTKEGYLIDLDDYQNNKHEQVLGYLSTDEVLQFMSWVANLPEDYVVKREQK